MEWEVLKHDLQGFLPESEINRLQALDLSHGVTAYASFSCRPFTLGEKFRDKHWEQVAKNIVTVYNCFCSGRGAVRLACLHGVQEVGGSNPLAPTENARIMSNECGSFLLLTRKYI